MNRKVSPTKPLDLNQWAFEYIKTKILDHEIKPGSQLDIEDLSQELNISRTPIREALLRLKQTGLVISYSRVGFFVSGITLEDFEDIFELRQLIETYAAEKAVEKMADEEINRLFKILEYGYEMARIGNIKEYNESDIQLHHAILNCINNKKIDAVMDSIRDLQHRISIYASLSPDNIQHSLEEHECILTSIKKRDTDLAHQAMKTHISGIRDRMRLVVEFQESHTRRENGTA